MTTRRGSFGLLVLSCTIHTQWMIHWDYTAHELLLLCEGCHSLLGVETIQVFCLHRVGISRNRNMPHFGWQLFAAIIFHTLLLSYFSLDRIDPGGVLCSPRADYFCRVSGQSEPWFYRHIGSFSSGQSWCSTDGVTLRSCTSSAHFWTPKSTWFVHPQDVDCDSLFQNETVSSTKKMGRTWPICSHHTAASYLSAVLHV